jgi:hypothetical protein
MKTKLLKELKEKYPYEFHKLNNYESILKIPSINYISVISTLDGGSFAGTFYLVCNGEKYPELKKALKDAIRKNRNKSYLKRLIANDRAKI